MEKLSKVGHLKSSTSALYMHIAEITYARTDCSSDDHSRSCVMRKPSSKLRKDKCDRVQKQPSFFGLQPGIIFSDKGSNL
jgi:hypothetical protein